MGWTSGQWGYMQRDSLGVRATVSPDGAWKKPVWGGHANLCSFLTKRKGLIKQVNAFLNGRFHPS